MPDVTVINDLNEDIHVAFFVGVPTNWKNHLKPGERWTTHLASLPLYFEARSPAVTDTPEFSHDESMKMFATIGGACAAGTASVVSAGALFATDMIAGIPMVSVPLMAAASAGGTKYGTWGEGGRKCTARVWVPLWDQPQYSVRMVGDKCVLWDVGANRVV
ncbi:hypothetical protein F4604DRAFT_1935419 [Suillus subluteus]|nr:hypothetical protein F4604DRAFT_1935419 [Suillus subluteus]